MGLKHLPLVSIVLLLLNILTGITLGGENLSGRLRCFSFCLKGNGRCWQILPWESKLLPFWELGNSNSFLMSFFPTIITKEILRKNVALNSFVGRIATVVARR
jgi:hypothetical protein